MSSVKDRKQSLLLSKIFRASWSIGLAAALLAAVPPGRVGTAENIVGGDFAPDLLDPAQDKEDIADHPLRNTHRPSPWSSGECRLR
jgi:hypothetical protein